jgi:glycosyltransferase involved in cell wall biosynthesis
VVASVVIPTFQRPQLVSRAVASALSQTVADIEAIVVVDGRDEATLATLRAIADPRVRIHLPDEHLGSAEARNVGVRLATAPWVAFLDDDDEWLPAKLEAQLRTAHASRLGHPIVSCRMIASDETGNFVWPRRLPGPGEPLSEYFFCRRTPFTGEGMVINSAILTSRELAAQVPFRRGLQRHLDPDWLLRAVGVPGAGLEFVPEQQPLLIWHIERGRPRITNQRDWTQSFAYCTTNRELFTPRGYAAFLLHVVGSNAAAQRVPSAFALLLREAFAHGRPTIVDLLSHVGNFLLPARVQRAMAGSFARLARGRKSAAGAVPAPPTRM